MIELRMTDELLMDMLTPGVCTGIKCTTGLPPDLKLVSVELSSTGIITYMFDDGKEEIESVPIAFISTYEENKE